MDCASLSLSVYRRGCAPHPLTPACPDRPCHVTEAMEVDPEEETDSLSQAPLLCPSPTPQRVCAPHPHVLWPAVSCYRGDGGRPRGGDGLPRPGSPAARVLWDVRQPDHHAGALSTHPTPCGTFLSAFRVTRTSYDFFFEWMSVSAWPVNAARWPPQVRRGVWEAGVNRQYPGSVVTGLLPECTSSFCAI